MKFAFVAKHRGIWPVRWMCEALGVSRSGFHAWLTRSPSKRARTDEETGARVRASFLASDRTYGAPLPAPRGEFRQSGKIKSDPDGRRFSRSPAMLCSPPGAASKASQQPPAPLGLLAPLPL